MTILKIEIEVNNITEAQRLIRILQRKSFKVHNEIIDFRIKP